MVVVDCQQYFQFFGWGVSHDFSLGVAGLPWFRCLYFLISLDLTFCLAHVHIIDVGFGDTLVVTPLQGISTILDPNKKGHDLKYGGVEWWDHSSSLLVLFVKFTVRRLSKAEPEGT